MTPKMMVLAASLLIASGSASALAQLVVTDVTPPVVDRWMYPFGSEVGTRPTVPVFGSQNNCGPDDRFDDRDSQFLMTFATGGAVESGWPLTAYRIIGATLTVRSSDATQFFYDGTPDPINSFFARGDASVPCAADPAYIADTDAGRQLELFGVAYRNGFNVFTYGESSPFKPGSAFVPPWIGVRNAYAIGFDGSGNAIDASSPIKGRSLLGRITTAVAPTATPGVMPADGTDFIFTIPTGAAGVREYLQTGLAQGRVSLLIASLFESQQQVVGTYPNLYTKEADPLLFPNAAAPRLSLDVYLCKADFNGDGDLNPDDLGDYITAYFSTPPGPGSDFNRDGDINPDDLGDYITAYFSGCP